VTINGSYDPIVGNFDASTNNTPKMHDIFWYAPGTAKDYVWMNTGAGFASEPETVNAKTYKPRVLAARGTGQDDILWNNPTGTDFIWKTTGLSGAFTYTSINATTTLGDPGTRTPLIADVDTGEATGGGSSAGMIDAGGNHTCAVTSTGGAQCWGYNVDGILGNGTTTSSAVPVNVTGLTSGVEAVATGLSHSCALTTAGGVKCWGNNSQGQLGNGTNTNSNVPVNVTGLTSGVTAISAGDAHTCALTTGGGVKCWGINVDGRLGNGTTTSSSVPVDVTGRTSGTAAISAGAMHTCAVTTTGAASCWGEGAFGRLGNNGVLPSNVPVAVAGLSTGTTAISAGTNHTCAINAGGAKCWGRNSSGHLGNGTTSNSSVPVNVTGLTSGTATISAGWDFTCAVTTAGGAKCWGDNGYRALGNGSNVSTSVPVDVSSHTSGVSTVSAGASHACIISTGYAARCWGYNAGGQVGDGTTDAFKPTATNVTGGASYGDAPTAAVGPNIDLLWWAPGNGAGQSEILWTELEHIS
jgi:alpha-tubulin suppressor-like RCC1 family protein